MSWVKEEVREALLSPASIRMSGWGEDVVVKDGFSKLWQLENWGDGGECPASWMSAGADVVKGDTKQSNPWVLLHSLLI